jgi:hypothetical protein
MGLWDKIKDVFTPEEYWEEPPPADMDPMPPPTRMQAQDVEFTPTPVNRVDRKLGRLLSLYNAREKTQETANEILRYRSDLERLGYTGLNDEQEVLALIEQLKGND